MKIKQNTCLERTKNKQTNKQKCWIPKSRWGRLVTHLQNSRGSRSVECAGLGFLACTRFFTAVRFILLGVIEVLHPRRLCQRLHIHHPTAPSESSLPQSLVHKQALKVEGKRSSDSAHVSLFQRSSNQGTSDRKRRFSQCQTRPSVRIPGIPRKSVFKPGIR